MHFSRFVYGAFVKQITGRHVAACLTGCAPSWLFRPARADFSRRIQRRLARGAGRRQNSLDHRRGCGAFLARIADVRLRSRFHGQDARRCADGRSHCQTAADACRRFLNRRDNWPPVHVRMPEEMDEPGLGKHALLALYRADVEYDTSAFFQDQVPAGERSSGSKPGRASDWFLNLPAT